MKSIDYTFKPLDSNSSLADHGVRKYDNTTKRFITPDALWEKYYAWSPYHYSANNPVNMSDGNGYWAILSGTQANEGFDILQNGTSFEISREEWEEI